MSYRSYQDNDVPKDVHLVSEHQGNLFEQKKGRLTMERKFCGKCGKPISECTCGTGESRHSTTSFGSKTASYTPAGRAGSYYIQRFDKIALCQGEVVVKQYHIGEFSKFLSKLGQGSASIIITNKRVISKQDSVSLGTSSTGIEEIELSSISGVRNYYSQGYTIWKLIIAFILLIAGIFFFISPGSQNSEYGEIMREMREMSGGSFGGGGGAGAVTIIGGLLSLAGAVYFVITSRKPSYLFSVYAGSANQAMQTGANLRGKLFNSKGDSLLFQYKPTEEAIAMMCEMGACIMDLKNKGDYAIEAWKKE